MPRTRGTSSRLQYYVLYLSLEFVHIVVMVLLCPPVLSRSSLLATHETAEDVSVSVLAKGGQSERGECGSFDSLFWCMFKIRQLAVERFCS